MQVTALVVTNKTTTGKGKNNNRNIKNIWISNSRVGIGSDEYNHPNNNQQSDIATAVTTTSMEHHQQQQRQQW